MFQHEEGQFEFSILGLVRDPLLDLIPKLAENVKSIAGLSNRLDTQKPDWREFDMLCIHGESFDVLTNADQNYGLTQEELDRAELPKEIARVSESGVVEDIIAKRQRLVTAQAELRLSIKEQQESNQSDEERAVARRCDYGARIQEFVRRVKIKRQELSEAETV